MVTKVADTEICSPVNMPHKIILRLAALGAPQLKCSITLLYTCLQFGVSISYIIYNKKINKGSNFLC